MCNWHSLSIIWQKISKKCYGAVACLLLLFGAGGIVGYNDDIQLSLAILSLGFLSFGMFYKKNIIHFIGNHVRPSIAAIIPWTFFAISAILMYKVEHISLESDNKIFFVPLYMAALSIGLYYANIVFTLEKTNDSPKS
jgi:predicted MFS family arabinose efflux permease